MKKTILVFALLLVLILPFVFAQQLYYVRGAWFSNNVANSNNANSLVSYGYVYGKKFNLNPNTWSFEIYFTPIACGNTNEHVYDWYYNITTTSGSSFSHGGILIYYCKIYFIWYQPISGAGLSYTNLTNNLTLGAKYYVAIVFNNPTLYFYVNGSFVFQTNVGANTLYNTTVGLSLGGFYGCVAKGGCFAQYGTNSTLYLLRIYNTTLTQSQISSNFNYIKNNQFDQYYNAYLIIYYAPYSVFQNRWINVAQNNYLTDAILVNTQIVNLTFYYAVVINTTTINNQVSFNIGSLAYIIAFILIGISALIFVSVLRYRE